MQDKTRLPLILDPSHAAGNSKYIAKLAYASTAFNCDGLLVEVHCDPSAALCDKAQALSLTEFAEIYSRVKQLAEINGRTVI
jgi:3-deoxy-7-phosphoheptulonate synthase